MGRFADTLVGKQGYGTDRLTPMVNPVRGGQFGHATEPAEHVSATQYVRKNLVIRLLEPPRGFGDLPNPALWRQTLKTILETHPNTVEGFNSQLTVEYASTPFGGAGEEQETVTDVKRARTTPSFAYTERYGRPISTFIDQWILELFGDPITKYPNVCTRVNKPVDLLSDYRTCSFIAFEPDPTFRYIDKAWLVVNAGPKGGAPVEGRRDMNSPGENLSFTLELTSISFVGRGIDELAQIFLNAMDATGANPNNRKAFIEAVDADVNSTAAPIGYAENLAQLARSTAAQ